MPGPAFHLLLASAVLDQWRRDTGRAPFPADSADERRAFLCGALAPDMGVAPGALPLISDLAHYIRPADLARELVAGACGPVESAYAWGWASHVLADLLGHPVINRAAAAFRRSARDSLTYADDPPAHVRVELGLDAVYCLDTHLPPEADSLRPALDPSRLLAEAYRRVYQVALPPPVFYRSHSRSLLAARWALRLGKFHGGRFTGRGTFRAGWLGCGVLLPVRVCAAANGSGSLLHALTHPAAPPAWLLAEFGSLRGRFADEFLRHASDNLVSLQNWNLDTGAADGGAYPLTVRTAGLLEGYRRTSVGSAAPPSA